MQVCPQFKVLPQAILRAALTISASLSTMQGLLPPSSRITGVRFLAAAAITTFPRYAYRQGDLLAPCKWCRDIHNKHHAQLRYEILAARTLVGRRYHVYSGPQSSLAH